MAKGQSQGLQVALIVSIVLVVILAVTTFFGFNEASTAKQDIADAHSERDAANAKAGLLEQQVTALVKRIGHVLPDPGTDPDQPGEGTVLEKVKEDIDLYKGNVDKTYKGLVAYLDQEYKSSEVEMSDLVAENRRLSESLEKRTAETNALLAQANSFRDDAQGDRANFIRDFTAEIDEQRKQVQALTEQVRDLTLERDQERKNNETLRMEHSERIQNLQARIQGLQDRVRSLEFVDLERPDGEIRRIDRRIKSVYINLGKADFLPQQISFSVYPRNARTLTDVKPKAKIEVVRILEDEEHMAEARITEEELYEPIEPGDLIYNPGWNPGRQIRFALAGRYLIDEDSSSDRDVIKALIKSFNGAVYQEDNPLEGTCEVLEGSGITLGAINHMTTYLVLGDPPQVGAEGGGVAAQGEVSGQQAERQAYDTLVDEARQFGVRVIPFRQFLDIVGYTSQRRLFRSGSDQPYSLRYGSRGAAVQGASNYDRYSPGKVSALYVPGFRAKMLPRSRTRVSGLYMPEHTTGASSGRVSRAVQDAEIIHEDRPEGSGTESQ